MSVDELADYHDLYREVTSEIMTHKMECNEHEKVILHPALMCYQKIRQATIFEESLAKLMGC